jgi:hypothetical protein
LCILRFFAAISTYILKKEYYMNQDQVITIVSGLPRSGTSLMMKMLEAGDMTIITDNIRKADVDNPKGYYEFEKVKKIKEDASWVKDTRGQSFKMVSMLLFDLPLDEEYKIIFMRRDFKEMLASQGKMLKRLNQKPATDNDQKMAAYFKKHLDKIENWLAEQDKMDILYISYNDIIQNPQKGALDVNQFLDNRLDAEKMKSVVDTSLYRNRMDAKI